MAILITSNKALLIRSVRRNGVVVNDYTANGAPDAAAMATLPDGVGGVGGGKNGVGGGSSKNRDNDGRDANGDRRRCPRPRPCQAATAVAMMTMAGIRGGKAMARQLQGEDEVTEMQRQSDMVPATN